MAAHPFRLQAVARLREARRDTLRGRLAEAIRAEEVLLQQRRELVERIGELTRQRLDMTRRSTDVSQLLAAQRYELSLRGQDQTLSENLAAVAKETEARRLALVEAEREVRALEVLKERAEEAERRERERIEGLALDEVASQKAFARRRAESADLPA